jgi:small subunit ribosomal protein S8
MKINLINLLIKLKNASILKKESVIVDYSSSILPLIKILYNEGFIQSFKIVTFKNIFGKNSRHINIILRFLYNKSVLKKIKIFSKPSHIKYINYFDICKVNDRNLTFFISTTSGILTSFECKKKKIGGKLLFVC